MENGTQVLITAEGPLVERNTTPRQRQPRSSTQNGETTEHVQDARKHKQRNITDDGSMSPRKKAPSAHAPFAIDARTFWWRFPKPTRSHMSTRQPTIIALWQPVPPTAQLLPPRPTHTLDLVRVSIKRERRLVRRRIHSHRRPHVFSFSWEWASQKGRKSDLGVCMPGRPPVWIDQQRRPGILEKMGIKKKIHGRQAQQQVADARGFATSATGESLCCDATDIRLPEVRRVRAATQTRRH